MSYLVTGKKFFICLISLYLLVDSLALSQDDTLFTPVSYIKLTSQNDLYQYYFQSDKHFTNGAHLQFSHPSINISLLRFLLIGNSFKGNNNFIISLGQDMHTPENYKINEVDSTDRPYAGLLYLTLNRTISSRVEKKQFTSNLFLGVIGPASGAAEVQNFLHKMIGNDLALGWQHQIRNGLILDYAVSYQKGIKNTPRYLDMSIKGTAHAGTLLNYASLSGKFILGRFNDPYTNLGLYNPKKVIQGKRSNFQFYTFLEGRIGYILYDGTASGSLVAFNESPYTIPQQEIYSWTYGGSYGICFSYKQLEVNYQRVLINQKYSLGGWFGWGELSLTYTF